MALPKHIQPKSNSHNGSEQRKKSHLKLVKGNHTDSRNSPRLVWGFVTFIIISLVALAMFASNNSLVLQVAYRQFFNLYEVLNQEGLQRFLEEKRILKDQIQQTLNDPKSESDEKAATNVALYLFPEILPTDNFERQVAIDAWAPLQEAIEKSPGSPESRLWFDEMRANIWNYESPDRGNPRVSPFAVEALRLYDKISLP